MMGMHSNRVLKCKFNCHSVITLKVTRSHGGTKHQPQHPLFAFMHDPDFPLKIKEVLNYKIKIYGVLF